MAIPSYASEQNYTVPSASSQQNQNDNKNRAAAQVSCINDSEQDASQMPQSWSLAGVLRKLGAFAVVASALVYMLQGVESVDESLRQWVYLIFMCVMAAGGCVSRFKFNDATGARVFFALAAVLIPVQFSQLAGMFYDLVRPASDIAIPVLGAQLPSTMLLGVMLGASVSIAIPLAFASFSILYREKRNALMVSFLLLNLALLLPWRADFLGMMVIITMMLIFTLAWKNTSLTRLFASQEIQMLVGILLMPVCIASVRAGFHVNTTVGLSILAFVFASILMFVVPFWTKVVFIRESSMFVGVVSMCVTVFVLAESSNLSLSWIYRCSIEFVIASAILLFAGMRNGKLSQVYFLLASAFAILCGTWLWAESTNIFTASILSLIAILFGGAGYLARRKLLVVVSLGALLAALVAFVSRAVADVDMNAWVFLGVAGAFLVLMSSMVEKHGKKLLVKAGDFWDGC